MSRLKDYSNLDIDKGGCLGRTDCGVIDDVGNHLCIPNDGSYQCPINFMKIAKEPPKDCEDELKCKVFKINEEWKIYVANDKKNGNIISQFVISDDTPCADPEILVSKQGYILEKNIVSDKSQCPKVSKKDYTFDERIKETNHKIGEIPKELIFSNIKAPIDYDTTKNTTIYSFPYIGYDRSKSPNKRQIFGKSRFDEFTFNNKTFKKYTLVTFIFHCIALPYYLIFPFYKLAKKENIFSAKGIKKNQFDSRNFVQRNFICLPHLII